jgi:UDP-glucose 4-epimerase
MGVNWLITGGCGFIGLNLVKNLIKEGEHYIRIVDNLSVGSREDLSQICNFNEFDLKTSRPSPSACITGHPQPFSNSSNETKSSALPAGLSIMPGKVDLIVNDILDAEIATKIAEGIDIIVHLAASTGVDPSVEDPKSDCLNNIVGTINYLEAARYNNIKRFIFASSGAPVGECEPPIHEEIVPHPVSPYGASKLSGEAYCSAYFQSFGVETVVLRFGNVYGPLSAQKNSVVAKFIKRALEGKPLIIYGDGKQTRDFIFVEDLVKAVLLSATSKNICGETFQIATSAETSIEELIEKLLPILGNSGLIEVKVYHAKPRVGDVKRNFSDTSKAQKILGWHAKTELSDGLKRTLEWFLEKSV